MKETKALLGETLLKLQVKKLKLHENDSLEKAQLEARLREYEKIINDLLKENENLKENQNVTREWLQANTTPPPSPVPTKKDRPHTQKRMRDVTILKDSDKTRTVLKSFEVFSIDACNMWQCILNLDQCHYKEKALWLLSS